MQPRTLLPFWAVSAHCRLVWSFSWTITPSPSPQGCSQALHPHRVLQTGIAPPAPARVLPWRQRTRSGAGAAMAAYSPRGLLGNWEAAARQEEIQLSVSKDGFVHFGDTVMLMNPESQSSVENHPGVCSSLTLAVYLDITSIYSVESLQAPCEVSAVESVDPVGRNTFCILSVDGSAVGEPIRFGQNFGLGTTGGLSEQMFYLASDHKSFTRFAKKSCLQQVYLSDELSFLTCWQANFLDPQLRLECEGLPVPADSKIVITHCYTNRSLAIPRNFWTSSYFGKEYEVICHTYLDSHKAEEDKNYWVIVTGNASDEGGTMIDRSNPHPSGIGKNEFSEET
ncbi:cilia- and flagella-associated protein 161 isoform X3 [Cuculus canorus]|uniref:cilia- and flagella-associated protein 161 isoform X3 n=1 Tax=Cuculus canorus TaxID=55661 RepID=UPI0023AA9D06|nr:cilia- and flagella-associated protein 161 isoform X3 [Cuculus canorus]